MRSFLLVICLILMATGCKSLDRNSSLSEPVDFLEMGNQAFSEMDVAMTYFHDGQWDKAMETFEPMRRKARRSPSKRHLTPLLDELMSRSYEGKARDVLAKTEPPSKKQIQEATRLLDRAIASDPTNTPAFNLWRELVK